MMLLMRRGSVAQMQPAGEVRQRVPDSAWAQLCVSVNFSFTRSSATSYSSSDSGSW